MCLYILKLLVKGIMMKVGVSGSRSVPKNPEPAVSSGSQERESKAGSGFLGTGTRCDVSRSGFLETRNPLWVPVPRNLEPVPTFCGKTIKGYVHIPLCLKMKKNGF